MIDDGCTADYSPVTKTASPFRASSIEISSFELRASQKPPFDGPGLHNGLLRIALCQAFCDNILHHYCAALPIRGLARWKVEQKPLCLRTQPKPPATPATGLYFVSLQ
ncbi:hypothetical protein DHEL01_v203604 [Diaporthe helianthi]|uniref:Uncharacterized protein n=1 Tax=Diaporthe helianthi TaxID=158607 RepID=A0A2P5I683_DIAHE|nr:hypothetical protein DHEL01_v203604 [Diaporthe helianthi]